MIPEIGHFALILALLLSAVQGILPIAGAARGNAAWMAVARPAAQGQFTFVAIAFGCLAYSFVNNDFSVLNVATNSNSQLPIQYRIAATWGSHEGSLLLWVLMLVTWMLAVALFSQRLPLATVARVLSIMGLISVGLLCFMLFTSNAARYDCVNVCPVAPCSKFAIRTSLGSSRRSIGPGARCAGVGAPGIGLRRLDVHGAGVGAAGGDDLHAADPLDRVRVGVRAAVGTHRLASGRLLDLAAIRQGHLEDRLDALTAAHRHAAAMALDDRLHDRQAKSGAACLQA